MPPRARITREMVVDAAFEVARVAGAEGINARSVSQKLGCSTQPVMWHFRTIADLRRAAYERANRFHSEFLLNLRSGQPMMDIGLNYLRFAATEKPLFRFLFQSDGFGVRRLSELLDDAELMPVYEILSREARTDVEQAKRIFKFLFLYVHGYAGMLANNAMGYDEREVSEDLERAFQGAVCAAERGER